MCAYEVCNDVLSYVILLIIKFLYLRSMQSLLVRFEPPDVFGVPASKEGTEVVPPEASCDNTVSELVVDVATVPVDTQPLSLPTNFPADAEHPSPVAFQSLPLLQKFSKCIRSWMYTVCVASG